MKIYNIRLILILLIAVNLSCEKNFLDTRLDTQLTDAEIRSNRSVLWNTGYSMYSGFKSGFSYMDNNFLAGITDEAQLTQPTGNAYYFTRGIVSPDVNPLQNRYAELYEGIRGAIYFLDFVKDGNGLDMIQFGRDTITDEYSYHRDLVQFNRLVAEAYVVRAFYYAELIKMYGDVPIVEHLFDKDPSQGGLNRVAYDDVVKYIIDLIDDHFDDLEEDWRTSADRANDYGRIDQRVALSLKSRVLLHAASPRNNPTGDPGKWEAAAKASRDFLQAYEYVLPENRNYENDFKGNNPVSSNANIFIIRRPDENSLETLNYPISSPGGNSGLTPSHNLVSAYEYIGEPDPTDPYLNRDPRLKATIVVNGSTWNGRGIAQAPGEVDDMNRANTSKTGYYLKKYLHEDLSLTQNTTTQHQWIELRYAEIYLNYAEAMNEAFGPDALPEGYTLTAREALTMVRNSASTELPEVTTTDKDEFRDVVKHERRVELAFEGHRYWDLIRWQDAVDVLNQPIIGVSISKGSDGDYEYDETIVEDRTFYDKNYYLPFSRTEITNSNGSLIQNEGY